MLSNYRYKAFTLVELAVSVTIIAIIIAAVTTGISIQNQAQVRKIASELDLIQSSMNNFKFQYGAYPGDITNATSLWPSATTTANGDGDNRISTYNNVLPGNEDVYLFQHLYLAGILPYPYIGVIQTPRYILGKNIYASFLNGGGYSVNYNNAYNYLGNFIEYGSLGSDSCSWHSNGSILSAPVSYQMDLKIDDGNPITGRVMAARACTQPVNICVDSNNMYVLNDSSVKCRIVYTLE